MKRLITLVCTTLFATVAFAQVTPTSEVQFEASTGPVTVKSVQPPIPNAADYAATVAQLDRNGDGVVVRSEVPAGHALASEFKLVDRNHDGRITDAELSNWK